MQTASQPSFTPGMAKAAFHAAVGDCTARTLKDNKEVSAFFDMHLDRYWSLPVSEQHFYKRVSFVEMRKYIRAGHKIIGLFGPLPEMPLLAGARMTSPELLPLDAHGDRTGLPDHPFDADGFSAQDWLHIQTLTAHVQTNGSGGVYTDAIFAGMEQYASEQGRKMLSGKMSWGNENGALNNHRSYNAFKRNGFEIISEPRQRGIDFYKSVIMAKTVTPGMPL